MTSQTKVASQLTAAGKDTYHGEVGGISEHVEKNYGFGLVLADFEVGSQLWDIVLDWLLSGNRSGYVIEYLNNSYLEGKKNGARIG